MGHLEKIAFLIEEIFDKNKKINILIITHRRADIDAYTAAYILNKILRLRYKEYCTIDILFPEGLSTRVNRIYSLIPCEYVDTIDTLKGHYDISFYLDVGGIAVIPNIEYLMGLAEKNVLIDHHIKDDKFASLFDIVNIDNIKSSSTVEITLDFGVKLINDFYGLLSKDECTAILSAILVETRFLQLAKATTIYRIYKLVECGADITTAFNMTRIEIDRSEKIALLKGMKRMEVYEANGVLIGISELSAYHSSLASKAISLGIDIAIIYGEYDDNYKVTVRLSNKVARELEMDAIKDILGVLKKHLGGELGGHASAGVLIINGEKISSTEHLRKIIIEVILTVFINMGMKWNRII